MRNSSGAISIITYGCTFNQGDSLKIQKILEDAGFSFSNIQDASIVIINTCAVKQNTELKILHFIKKLSDSTTKKLVITGCLPQIDREIFNNIKTTILKNKGIIIHPRNIGKIADYLSKDDIFQYREDLDPNTNEWDKSFLSPMNDGKKAIIQISEGCNNRCSYCCTTLARGPLISFNYNNIIKQIQSLANDGIREFFITSQDLGNYYFEGKNLIDLLHSISQIKGDFKIRLGMINPDFFNEIDINEFLDIFTDNRFYRFLHIPIQSASNSILKKMNRHYAIEDVDRILHHILKNKNFTIATDIIVGFPTETEEDFILTKKWIARWKPMVVNISKYSDRPNTLSKNLPKVESSIIKARSKNLSLFYSRYVAEKLKSLIGKEMSVFINEYHNNKEFPYMGRTINYLPVVLKEGDLWTEKRVKIREIKSHSLVGVPID